MKIFKVIIFFIGLLSEIFSVSGQSVTIQASKTSTTPLVIALVGHENQAFREKGSMLARALEWTELFTVSVVEMKHHPHHKNDIKKYADKGRLFIAIEEGSHSFEIRVYEVKTGQFIKGERIEKKGGDRAQAYAIADEIFKELTGLPGSSSSLIVYCKKDQKNKNKTLLCVSDCDGSHERVITTINEIAVAPRWNRDEEVPFILYSEYTPVNLALMLVDLKGNRRVAVNFDGINMQPAFSPQGDHVLVCLSVEGSTHIYKCVTDRLTGKRKFIRLTSGSSNNLSPVYMGEHEIAFCSDRAGMRPEIFTMNDHGKHIKKISTAMAVSPTYCSQTGMLAYIEFIKGVAQIILYNPKTGVKEQVTHDSMHKEDVSFSPCGNYIVFSVIYEGRQQIVVQSFLTGSRRLITDSQALCGYPCWSWFQLVI